MYRRTATIIIAALLVAPLTFGQTDCLPTNIGLAGVPFTIDPNQLVPDPDTGIRYLLRWAVVEVGHEVFFEGDVCDPDGDPVKSVIAGNAAKYTVTFDPNDSAWAFTFRPTSIGVHYCSLTATDAPILLPETSRSTISNIVVSAIPANRPPAIRCGGQ